MDEVVSNSLCTIEKDVACSGLSFAPFVRNNHIAQTEKLTPSKAKSAHRSGDICSLALVNKNWTRDSKNMSQKMGCGTTHADVLTGYDESSCKTSATLDSAPRNALEVLPTVRNS